jgi:hypothetical protein
VMISERKGGEGGELSGMSVMTGVSVSDER